MDQDIHVPRVFLHFIIAYFVSQVNGIGDDSIFWCSENRFMFINTTKQWLSGSLNLDLRSVRFSQPDARLSATSFLFRTDYLVFGDKGSRTIFLYQDHPMPRGVFAHVGVSEGIGELAVDWLNFNLYWCDGVYSWIGLQALPRDLTLATNNDKQRIVVEKDLKKPYGIAVSPQKRFIFWTDYGQKPRIERSTLTGENRQTLIWMGLKKPMSITTDPSTSKLFWIDNARATLETCDFEGQGRQVLSQRLGFSLTSLAVFETNILYTEANNQSIHVVSMVTGEQSARTLEIGQETVGVSVFSKSLQPFTESACDSQGCSHICVQEADRSRCMCDGGFILDADGKTCSASPSNNLWKSIVFSNGSQICALPVTTFNSHKYIPIEVTCLTSGVDIVFLAADTESSSLFYSSRNSIQRKTIGGEDHTITTSSNEITGLVWDSVNRQVIWSDGQDGIIQKVAIINGSKSHNIYSGLLSPSALALDAKSRRLFWISATSPARIEKGDVNGGPVSELVGSDLKQPVRLTFDPRRNRLYWTEDGRIGSVLTDGTMRAAHPLSPLPSYIGISVFKDYLVWMTRELTVSVSVAVIHDDDVMKPTTFTIPNITDVTDVVVYDSDNILLDESSCGSDNGGCVQVCIPGDNSRQCQCDFGFKLQSDGRTCRSDLVQTDFFLVLDDVHNRVYQVLDNNIVHGVSVPDDKTPSIITYDTQRGKVIWYDPIRRLISESHLNGSGETVVTGTENWIVQDMAVDSSTSSIYYTVKSLDDATGSVRLISPDGVTRRILVQIQGTPGPLVVHSKLDLLIWGEGSVIKMADTSGRGTSTLISSQLTSVTDLDLDIDGKILYVADSDGDKIEIVVLRSLSRTILRRKTQEFPSAVGVKGDKLYYLTKGGRTIKAIQKMTGEELSSVSSAAEFGHLSAFYVYVDRTVTDLKCPLSLLHGQFSTDCSPYPDNICSYTCDDGYETKLSSQLVCSKTGNWNVSLDTLCFAVQIPPTTPLPVGVIVGVCVAVIVVAGTIVVAVVCYKRRHRRQHTDYHHPEVSLSGSQLPIITVSKTDENVYDEIVRYSSFSRVSPNAARRKPREDNYDSEATKYLSPTDLMPAPVPRPASTYTPNTRRKMFRSESPVPDYETPISGSPSPSYIDLTLTEDATQ